MLIRAQNAYTRTRQVDVVDIISLARALQPWSSGTLSVIATPLTGEIAAPPPIGEVPLGQATSTVLSVVLPQSLSAITRW